MRVQTFVGFLCLSLGGCAAVQDCHYSMVNNFRASHAWYGSPESSGDCSHHYARGWKRGYYDVSTGSCGQPPAVPPAKYWSARYQDPDGQQAVDDWYRGYQCGVIAAEQCGHPHWNAVPSHSAPTWQPMPSDLAIPPEAPAMPLADPGLPYETPGSAPPPPADANY